MYPFEVSKSLLRKQAMFNDNVVYEDPKVAPRSLSLQRRSFQEASNAM